MKYILATLFAALLIAPLAFTGQPDQGVRGDTLLACDKCDKHKKKCKEGCDCKKCKEKAKDDALLACDKCKKHKKKCKEGCECDKCRSENRRS